MNHYSIDWPSVEKAFPPGTTPPPLLADWAQWLRKRTWGCVGCFDLQGSLIDDAPLVDGTPLRRDFALFLRLPDGSVAGLWLEQGRRPDDAPVVALGSEGQSATLAPSLPAFLAQLARGHFTQSRAWSDLAPHEDSPDATPELAAWLRQHPGVADLGPLAAGPQEREDTFEGFARRWSEAREAHWEAHPTMTALAALLGSCRPSADAEPWECTHLEARWVGDAYALYELRRGWQPVREAAQAQPLLRALRDEQHRADPELGLWAAMKFTLDAQGRISPRFDYMGRPDIDGQPVAAQQARKDLARAPRPSRWVPDWMTS